MPKKKETISRMQFRKICSLSVKYEFCYCYLCGQPITEKQRWNLDHVHPKSKGGATTPENLRPVHYYCNQAKADLLLEEYRSKQR